MSGLNEVGARDAPTLAVTDLTVGLPPDGDRKYAVSNASFSVEAGQTRCLVGESGSGKSVIGNAIMGMLPTALPQLSGTVLLHGEPMPEQRSPAYERIRSARIATIFQDASASLNPIKRIGRQLAEILEVHGFDADQHGSRIREILAAVRLDDPDRIMRAYPHQISGGQAQRVVIAGALLLRPALLIADEPTTALDVTTQASILELIADLKEEFGLAVLFVTHDFGVVATIADHVSVMKDGVIVEQGTASDVLRSPQHEYTRRLIAAAQPVAPNRASTMREELLTARDINLIYRAGGPLSRRITHSVKDVSLDIAKGQTLGLVGESGSGKSSLARALLRLEETESGIIRFKGRDITRLGGLDLQKLRKSIQVVLQDPFSALNPRKVVRSSIAEGPIIHGMPKAQAYARAEELLELTGLSANAGMRYPHEFSGGQRQRICIARALALEPELLVADEAVSALDASVQAQILDLFADMQEKFGFAMLFITHDLRVARAVCDEIIVMKSGEILEKGPVPQVFETPSHAYTKALLAAAPTSDFSRVGGV